MTSNMSITSAQKAESIRLVRAEIIETRARQEGVREQCSCFRPCEQGRYRGQRCCKLCGGIIR